MSFLGIGWEDVVVGAAGLVGGAAGPLGAMAASYATSALIENIKGGSSADVLRVGLTDGVGGLIGGAVGRLAGRAVASVMKSQLTKSAMKTDGVAGVEKFLKAESLSVDEFGIKGAMAGGGAGAAAANNLVVPREDDLFRWVGEFLPTTGIGRGDTG